MVTLNYRTCTLHGSWWPWRFNQSEHRHEKVKLKDRFDALRVYIIINIGKRRFDKEFMNFIKSCYKAII